MVELSNFYKNKCIKKIYTYKKNTPAPTKNTKTNITLGGNKLEQVQEFCQPGSTITEDSKSKRIYKGFPKYRELSL